MKRKPDIWDVAQVLFLGAVFIYAALVVSNAFASDRCERVWDPYANRYVTVCTSGQEGDGQRCHKVWDPYAEKYVTVCE